MNDRRKRRGKKILYTSILLIGLVTITAIAAIYMLREADFSLTIHNYTDASGAALTGFYEGGNQYLITLHSPNNTRTYDNSHTLKIRYTDQIADIYDGSTHVKMYSTATVTGDFTQGGWIVERVFNIGVNESAQYTHIMFKVKNPSHAEEAVLYCYKIWDYGPGTTQHVEYMGMLDLTDPHSVITTGSHSWSGNYRISYSCNLTLIYNQEMDDTFTVEVYQSST
ncbi:MAG: hypothetical protein LRS45_00780 [Desulfurococcales archaeon]|nr:hypothetical protein [Desulfurococcales archaeon]